LDANKVKEKAKAAAGMCRLAAINGYDPAYKAKVRQTDQP